MGSDGLVELDQSCWNALAKYNLALATLFGVLALTFRSLGVGSTVLVVENAALAVLSGAIQSYAWISR